MLGRKILRPNKNQFIMKRRLPEGGFRFLFIKDALL